MVNQVAIYAQLSVDSNQLGGGGQHQKGKPPLYLPVGEQKRYH